jgi:hypothetical protein
MAAGPDAAALEGSPGGEVGPGSEEATAGVDAGGVDEPHDASPAKSIRQRSGRFIRRAYPVW